MAQAADGMTVRDWAVYQSLDPSRLATDAEITRGLTAVGQNVTALMNAPKGEELYDLVLVAVGRSPNGKKIAAEKAGIAVTEHGFINVDKFAACAPDHVLGGAPEIDSRSVMAGARASPTRACRASASCSRS